jgi:UDP-N-acetylglucosamine 1-carboxyvinyltransferase
MDALIIEGPARLQGTVTISGSKNTALPLLFGALLFDDEVRYTNVPRLWDIETTLKLLETMGTESKWDKEAGTISIYPKVHRPVAPYEWVSKMRAGILALGPLVAKCGQAHVSLPGGCAIGARPVNFHIDALKQMGVDIEVEQGYIRAKVKDRLHGATITFPQVTVTGTENVMFVAAVADGKTILQNAACEPEVVALGEMLIACGAKISGLGTPRMEIEGGKLHAPHEPIAIPADRIETGTWMATAIATRNPLKLVGCDASKMTSVIEAFRAMGAKLSLRNGGTEIDVEPAASARSLTRFRSADCASSAGVGRTRRSTSRSFTTPSRSYFAS